MKRILLLEDDSTLGEGIRFALESASLRIELCSTLAEAQSRLSAIQFDLLLLDVNLPDGSGLELLRQVRGSGSPVPIILLTANDLETDVVMGLESGADDYVTKPFSLAILRARVNAQLRRDTPSQSQPIRQGPFAFDFANMQFAKAGQPIELSKSEQKLLRLLVTHRGATLSREALIQQVWADGALYVNENALSVTIKRLRDKLEDNPAKPRWLKTVYGIGYIWSAQNQQAEEY